MNRRSTAFLLFIAGLGGLLYGIDFGVIAVSMPYIRELGLFSRVSFFGSGISQELALSLIVGAVMFGGILASATAGVLCDWLGRKKMIITAAAIFLLAVPVVCLSGESLAVMLFGRTLQGMSAGYMAVVMPMYIAETMPADIRGRGTGVFQLFLGIGLVTAAVVGFLLSAVWGASDSAAEAAVKDFVWRLNFWWTMAPVAVLFAGAMLIPESPVWLAKKTGKAVAGSGGAGSEKVVKPSPGGSLLQRKYVIPFVLAVLVLTFNKTIGMSSIVAYAVTLFQEAGLSGSLANVGDISLKATNLVMTLVALSLVDRKGRRWLLKLGTAGLTIGLSLIGVLYLALQYGWLGRSSTSGFIMLGAFIAMQSFYSIGPGICVWLVLSELMPSRIRANGMAIALFANQFTAWGLASSFLPMVRSLGYGWVFLMFAFTGVLYFVTVLFIPETRGRTLEEIEASW